MTTRALIPLALAATLAAYFAGSTTRTVAQAPRAQPETHRFQIVAGDRATYLLDNGTGDTWRWVRGPNDGRMGWQYHDRPSRIENCTTSIESPEEPLTKLCWQEPRDRYQARNLHLRP